MVSRIALIVFFALSPLTFAAAEKVNVIVIAQGIDTIRNPYALIYKQAARDDGTPKFLERIDGLNADASGSGWWSIRVPVDSTYFSPGILITVVARTGSGKIWSSPAAGITTLAMSAASMQTTKAVCRDLTRVDKEKQVKDMPAEKLKKLIDSREKERDALSIEVNKRLNQQLIDKIESVERKLGLRSENEASPTGSISIESLLKRLAVIDSLLGSVPGT